MSQIKRSLAIRPTYTRQISEQSAIEMASPLSTIPPPSVMDEFERNPVRSGTLPTRSNTAPVVVNGRVYNIYRPIVDGAQNVILEGARLAGVAWRAPFQTGTVLAVTGLTAWVIALTVKLSRANTDIDALYNMPFCEDMPATTGQGILPVKYNYN